MAKGPDFATRFRACDARILASVRAGDTARTRRDATRPGSRRHLAAERAIFAAQDEHTRAWAERNAISAEYARHYAATYGKES